MKIILTALAVLMLAVSAHGITRYVAQTAGTFSGGTACNGQTAITPATFNGLTLAAGDITYVCGTITVAQSTTGLQINNSGTSGNPISIIFDSGSVMKSTEWPADGTSGAIDLGGNSYITINGQGTSTGGGGIIEATLNGDPGATCLGGSCTLHGDSNCVEGGTNSTNITIEGLSCIDMYVATSPNPGGGTCMYEHGNISGWVVQNNFMHDAGWCVSLQYDSGPSNGVTIANNQIYNIDHGIALGGPSASQTLENVNVYGNNIHDYSNWDDPADNWHHDGIHIWGDGDSGTDLIQNVNIYNNKFGGCIGQDVTAHIFIETNNGNTKNVNIFNNTLIDTCNGADNDGLLTASDPAYSVYNNTFIGTAGDTCVGLSGSANSIFVNNVVSGCGILQYITAGGGFAPGGLHNNIYANCTSSNCFAFPGGYTPSFAAWQSYTNQDASPSAYVTSANLNSSGVPSSGSAVIGNGANLTSLGITALNSDITGATRPSSGAWDIGAYNYSGGGTNYSWTPNIVGSGNLTGTNCASGSYASGTTIGGCTANAGTGYSFTGWSAVSGSAGCTGTTNPCASFSITANSAATATFTINNYTLSTATAGTGSGTVSGCAGSHNYGASYSCTVTPSTGSTLTSVSGCGGSGTTTYAGTMPASACTVTATFTINSYTVTVSKTGSGSGSGSVGGCATGSYNYGTVLSCTASYSSGAVFTTWGGVCSGMGNCGPTVTSNISISANFVTTTAQYLGIETATAATTPNLSNPGWNINNQPADTGGVNSPASQSQTNGQSSPAGGCTSTSQKDTLTTIATSTQTNVLFWYYGTGDDGATNFVEEACIYVTNIAAANNIEIDFDQYNVTQGKLHSFGHQYNISSGCWQYANNSSGWQTTTACPAFAGNTWHHVIWTGHQDSGHNYYDELTFDGITYNINATLASESLGVLPTALIPQVQIDAGPTSGSAATVSYNVDDFNFSAYTALTPGNPFLAIGPP